MSSVPENTLVFRNGAQELDLPGASKEVFSVLQQTVQKISPKSETENGKIIYRYGKLPESESFSKSFFPNKAQDIFEVLSSVGLKPARDKSAYVPEVYGYDKNGALTAEGHVAVAILIAGPVKINIHIESRTIPYLWQPGKVLLLMPEARIFRDYKGESHDANMEMVEKDKGNVEIGNRVASGKELLVVFYAMFPIAEV